MCLVLQGAPADGYNKSDNNQVAAAASNPDLTFSQMDAAAASNTGLSEDGVGEFTWGLAYPDTKRADVKTGKASFDGLGQIIKPSQGPAEGEISTASDFHTGLLSSSAALNAAGPSSIAARSTCVSDRGSWKCQSQKCSESGTRSCPPGHHGCQVKAQSDAFGYHHREHRARATIQLSLFI